MKVYELRRETVIPRPLTEIFDWFSDARNLEILTPAFLHFKILTPTPIEMKAGAKIEYSIRVHGIPVRWKTTIESWDSPKSFVDTQTSGPYALWHHTHRFREHDSGTWMEDVVKYALPCGVLGQLAHWLMVRRDVTAIFDYRAARIGELFPAGVTSAR